MILNYWYCWYSNIELLLPCLLRLGSFVMISVLPPTEYWFDFMKRMLSCLNKYMSTREKYDGLGGRLSPLGETEKTRCRVSQSPSYQPSGYSFISVIMYNVHASIVLPGSHITQLKAMGGGRSEMGGSRTSYTGVSQVFIVRIAVQWIVPLLGTVRCSDNGRDWKDPVSYIPI